MKPAIVAALLLLCLSPGAVLAARILGIFPHVGKSHFIMFEPLMKALAARGHNVVVVSQFPLKNPPPRYTDISLEGSIPGAYVNSLPFGDFGKEHVAPTVALLSAMGVTCCEKVLAFPPVQKLIKSQETFDLVIYELFNVDCFLGFVHKFQAPSIALSSSVLMPWGNDRFGNPDNPSYIPNHFLPHSDRMDYFERLKNMLYLVGTKIVYKVAVDIPSNKIAKQHFGESLPPLEDIAANTSLLLLNTHFSYNQVRPNVPAIVEVGGIHIEPPKKLPQDLEKFLSEAKHGVIYFSLGSTLRTSTMPAETLEALLAAFSELPQKVLWKWEDDSMPGKPDNVKISKWLPQMSILAHPNVKVFVNHGGLMGTQEAVYNGVPMVSIPLFGDQYNNVQLCVEKGISAKLLYTDITKESVLKVMREVLENPRYSENAKRVSRIYHDRPEPAMDTAMYWIEYVIRHRGAPHLRSAALDLHLYQYLLIDVVLVVVAAIAVVIIVALIFLYQLFKFVSWLYCHLGSCFKQGGSKSTARSSPKKVKAKKN